jgi:broad specificity phosphatase PhoE
VKRVILWRHGRTAWNAESRFQGQTDIELDELGLRQAKAAADQLALLEPVAVVSSDLQRASRTAQFLAERMRLTVSLDPGLRETFAGEWEGLTRRELDERFGDEWPRWTADSYMRPGGGETRIEVADRVAASVERQMDQVSDGATVVFATHGGAARAGIGRLLGLPPEHWSVLGVLTNCSWSVLTQNPSGHGPAWRLQEYNAGTLPETALSDDR